MFLCICFLSLIYMKKKILMFTCFNKLGGAWFLTAALGASQLENACCTTNDVFLNSRSGSYSNFFS